jgi:hypothetical protein
VSSEVVKGGLQVLLWGGQDAARETGDVPVGQGAANAAAKRACKWSCGAKEEFRVIVAWDYWSYEYSFVFLY